jgi:hypothetical protein
MTNIYLMAAIGAIIPELIKLVEGKYNPSLPTHFKNLNFWLALIGQILLGVFTVFLLEKQITTNVAAAACGFGGSTILTKILSSFSPSPNRKGLEPISQNDKGFMWYWK